ncbi:hypothetical protein HYH03_002872 [Edaphochlamys debaryana]|uniref:Uncharacterized protein n=1 Tax=Edaphochlamys debaryana TaxID=47281 RepID=A0A835YKD6_9CHLO|nr:hypothetical protein HYH03_002872 [Edaphochlamys debaryana]|eukprot:KAG2499294.1 hypothetical protein HYH03_002872 [Edaphochlamys debaryana]
MRTPPGLWLLFIPGINLVYQVLMFTPRYDDLDRVLSTLGVLAALVLALAVTLVLAVQYDVIAAADARLLLHSETNNYARYYQKFNTGHSAPSKNFILQAFGSIVALTMCLVLDVLLYTFMAFARIRGDSHRRWYRFERWILLLLVALLITGTYFFFAALVFFTMMMTPDYIVEDEGSRGLKGVYDMAYFLVWTIVVGAVVASVIVGAANYHSLRDPLDDNGSLISSSSRVTPLPGWSLPKRWSDTDSGGTQGDRAPEPAVPAAEITVGIAGEADHEGQVTT